MIEPTDPQASPAHESPPHTGVARVDEALGGLGDLVEAPLAEQHDRLAQAHAALRDALAASGEPESEGSDGRGDPARP